MCRFFQTIQEYFQACFKPNRFLIQTQQKSFMTIGLNSNNIIASTDKSNPIQGRSEGGLTRKNFKQVSFFVMIGKILKGIICHFPLNTEVRHNQNVFYRVQNIQTNVSPYTSPRNWQIFTKNRNRRKYPKDGLSDFNHLHKTTDI